MGLTRAIVVRIRMVLGLRISKSLVWITRWISRTMRTTWMGKRCSRIPTARWTRISTTPRDQTLTNCSTAATMAVRKIIIVGIRGRVMGRWKKIMLGENRGLIMLIISCFFRVGRISDGGRRRRAGEREEREGIAERKVEYRERRRDVGFLYYCSIFCIGLVGWRITGGCFMGWG